MGPLWKEPPSASSLAPAVNPARVRSMGRLGSQPGPALASLSLRFLICTMASRGGGGGAVLVSRCCAAPARAGGAAAAAAGAGVGCQESPHRQLLPPGAARGLQPSAGTRQAQVSGGWGAGGAATPWLGGGGCPPHSGGVFCPQDAALAPELLAAAEYSTRPGANLEGLLRQLETVSGELWAPGPGRTRGWGTPETQPAGAGRRRGGAAGLTHSLTRDTVAQCLCQA